MGSLKLVFSRPKMIALRRDMAMESVRLGFLVLVWLLDVSTATLSPTGVNYEG